MFKRLPEDLALVILFTLSCIPFVLIPPLNETPIRMLLGLPLVLFLPGYSLIAVLFPRRDDLSVIERIALSFGLSIAVVPLLGLALNYTPLGIRLSPVLITLSIFTVSLAIGAYLRRRTIPEEDRFTVKLGSTLTKMKNSFKTTDTKTDRILTLILIASIVLAISMTVYVITMPKEGEKFTEFYILGINGTADDYPTNLKLGAEGRVIIGVVNHEYRESTYRLVARLNEEVIGEERVELGHNERWEEPFIFTATKRGKDQRLEFLLYKNGEEDVYRSLHLWIDVT